MSELIDRDTMRRVVLERSSLASLEECNPVSENMDSKEQEALARQLWAIHYEALGYLPNEIDFDHYSERSREAWIQVAQWVEALITPQAIVVRLSDDDRDAMRKQFSDEIRMKRVWDKDRFSFDEPDHK